METLKRIPFLRTDLLTIIALYLFMAPVSWPLVSFMTIPAVNIVVTVLIAFLLPLTMYNSLISIAGDNMQVSKSKMFIFILFASALELIAFKFGGISIYPGHDMDLAVLILPVLGGAVLAFVFGRIFNR